MNIYSIQISSVDFISIIRIEPADFAAMKMEIYYRYILRTSIRDQINVTVDLFLIQFVFRLSTNS